MVTAGNKTPIVGQSFIYLFTYLFTYLSIYLFIYLFILIWPKS